MIAAVLLGAVILGRRPSPLWIGLMVGLGVLAVLLKRPVLGLFLVIVVALIGPISISTGTEVYLNLAALLLPLLLVIWLLIGMNRHDVRLVASPTTKPLIAFLILVIISIFVSNALWDPNVPRRGNFILVQFGQWGLFALSAVAFWLVGNFVKQEIWLRRLTATFFVVGGMLAVIRVVPGGTNITSVVATSAITRACCAARAPQSRPECAPLISRPSPADRAAASATRAPLTSITPATATATNTE